MSCIKDFYDSYWQVEYPLPEGDPWINFRKKLLSKYLINYVDSHSIILDAGCGSGDLLSFISKLGYNVIGIDISAIALKKAHNKYPLHDFILSSIDAIPFKNDSFDAVWFSEVLEHVVDVHKSLIELRRVIKENGILIITTPYHGLIKNICISLFAFNRYFDPYGSHIRFFSKKSLNKCLKRAGFKTIICRGAGRLFPFQRFILSVSIKQDHSNPPIHGTSSL